MGKDIARQAESEHLHSESQSLQDLSDLNDNKEEEFAMEFDKSKYGSDLSKMAVVTSGDEVVLEVFEGQDATLEFSVENQSQIEWPFKPFLQNEKDHSQRQIVNEILSPGMKTTVRFHFNVPTGTNQKFYTIRLQLVDPYKFEKIDDQTLIGFCQIKPRPQASIPNFS